jgi:hypothetical protein
MKIMQISIKRKTTTALVLVIFALGSFALLHGTLAVSPAPDGGYSGANTAEGQSALLALTTGTYNTAVGWFSLRSLTDGKFCTGIGGGALLANTADNNTATGAGALLTNTTGGDNTANGAFALFSNVSGSFNTATGAGALESNIASNNTAVGSLALLGNTTGIRNTAVGADALGDNVSGNDNTAIGNGALVLSTGGKNTGIGSGALGNNTSGISNTAIGDGALGDNTTGGGNIALGYAAGNNVTTANNVICIGTDGNNVGDACYIGNIFTSTVNDSAVFVNSNGRLGITTSSRRFKEEIKPMGKASESLLALKPVTFRYKKEIDPQRISQFGLVAEEVEKVNPDLVVRDKEGKPYSVRYEQVNAMLLNEFLKAHRKIEEQEATITQLRKKMEAVVAHAKEQDSKIQKVSDEIEIDKATPTVVRNDSRK